jgi:hypothetical protein
MKMVEESIQKILQTENGFKPIEAEALQISGRILPTALLPLSFDLLLHEAYQVRSLAMFLMGSLAAKEPLALDKIRKQARLDENWRVQEIAAKAFDQYCRETGYEAALPVIKDWLEDPHPNVCRAVTEGLRIWTGRPYFKDHPEMAIQLLSQHRANESE